jgi:hypothetical protein
MPTRPTSGSPVPLSPTMPNAVIATASKLASTFFRPRRSGVSP